MPDTPLRPDELDDYRTEVQTAEVAPDDSRPPPDENQRPWVLAGMILLGIFVLALVIAVASALA